METAIQFTPLTPGQWWGGMSGHWSGVKAVPTNQPGKDLGLAISMSLN